MEQLVLDLPAALAAAGEAMEQVESSTERKLPGWKEAALAEVHEFAKVTKEFTAEQFRFAMQEKGFPKPEEPRAWGPVFHKAARNGWIIRAGFEQAQSPTVHGRFNTKWASCLT